MLHVPVGANSFGQALPSWGSTRPIAANGTAVSPAIGSYGSWAQLFAATTQDTYGILININSNSASAASRGTVIDIGWDEAGGTSYIARVTGLLCGSAAAYNISGSGVWYYFPIFIPAGSRIAARGNSTVTATFRVGAVLMQMPSNPAMIRKGSFVETLGISGNIGTVVVPGTTSEGSWTLIGTTTKRLWWWQVGMQVAVADTSWNGNVIHVDVAVGDGTEFDVIISDTLITTSAAEALTNIPITAGVEWDVPSGSNIYIRAQCSGTLDTYTAAVYGLGG
jgi:hypothetical protein